MYIPYLLTASSWLRLNVTPSLVGSVLCIESIGVTSADSWVAPGIVVFTSSIGSSRSTITPGR